MIAGRGREVRTQGRSDVTTESGSEQKVDLFVLKLDFKLLPWDSVTLAQGHNSNLWW